MGVSMHRMGPSFKRANFGFPILGLGLLFPLIPSLEASCILAIPILSELDSSQAIEGISAIFGFAVGILPFIAGILLSERGSSIDGESAPLSEEEEKLVQTILVRRIGGE